MARVLFIDDRIEEVARQWRFSGCEDKHELLPLEPFNSLERTCQMIDALKPDIILVGYGLGKPNITGSDVVKSLRQRGYSGYVVANSGGGVEQFADAVDGTANRSPHDLKIIMNSLTRKA